MRSSESVFKEIKHQVNLLTFSALVISAVVLIAAGTVSANDSTAALGAGGIELTKNEHIRILEEVLEISPNNIRVRYRFLNESDQDIHTKVAFPLPLYDGIANANVSIANPDNIFASFKISVDNKPVATQHERKALLDGKDITDKLRKLGLSDQEIFFDVSEDKKADLWEKLKLIPEIVPLGFCREGSRGSVPVVEMLPFLELLG
jgi:hypothetical protein